MALSVFLITLFIIQISSLIHLSAETDKSNRIIASIIDLQKTAIDMETGIRSYHLTGKKKSQDGYLDGKKSFPIQIKKLEELFESNLIYYHEMDEISALMGRWFETQAKWSLSRSDRDEVKSKKVMDQVRAITSGILEQENRKLENNKIKRINNANNTILYSVLLALALGFILAMIIRQQMIKLFRSYEQNYNEMIEARRDLELLNSDLEKKVAERTMSLKSVNDELETFCYSVSHDLRSPLRGIDGFSLALLEDYSDKIDAEGKRYLGFIREGVQRMGQLIDDLLRLSRINRSAVQFQRFDMLDLVEDVIKTIKLNSGSSNVQFVTKLEHAPVYGDRGLIRIVLENLFQNAVKYSSKQSSPVIEFGKCLADSSHEECFYIKDNGIGFNMDHYGKLFAAFQRLHPETEYPGTGIGLATVKRIIARHGGKIWASGAPSKGATFFFKIADLGLKGGVNAIAQDAVAY